MRPLSARRPPRRREGEPVSTWKRWWWVILLLPLAAGGVFAVWAESGPSPMPEAQVALETPAADDGILVDRGRWFTFRPTQEEVSTGLVIYPGGRVDPAAYAPAARAIADEGYLVVIVPMPLDLAFLAPQRADGIQQAYPMIEHWAVGGHSLGGAMAARFAHRHPAAVDGLLLWAAYPAQSDDLSQYEVEVVSIYGTSDGLATIDDIEASRPLLPTDTIWVSIVGGNHAQFGWYGPQQGDLPATISREAQQQQVIDGSLRLLAALES